MRRREAGGYTMLEVLVVMAIIMMLAALLLPVFGNAKERARRAVCANNIHQLMLAIAMYGTDNAGVLPTGIRDDGYEHTPWIGTGTYNALVSYTSDAVHRCPNFTFFPYYRAGVGYVFGYHYLAGHTTPWPGTAWTSPTRATTPNASELAVFADVTERGVDHETFVPHTKNGYRGGPLLSSAFANGCSGGNVGYLDGSVRWKRATTMTEYPTARGGSYWGYW